MLALSLAARRHGYAVLNWHYRSTRATIDAHAAAFVREVLPRLQRAPRVHFVTRRTNSGRAVSPPPSRRHLPLGVIAGSRSHIPLFNAWMHHAPNDGVVAFERTKVAGMQDFLVLHRTHTTLPWSPHAIAAAFRFLREGRLG